MKIIAYYRVSTDKQGLPGQEVKKSDKKKSRGLGIEAQRAAVKEFAEKNNATILAHYTEIESGRTNERPELLKALAHCKMNKATLVVAKLDRLSRNLSFTAALLDSDVEFIICDFPHANRLTIHILAAMAEYEAAQIRRRTKDALAQLKKKGVKLGSARPGHWDGREHLRGWKQGAEKSAKLRSERALSTYAFIIPKIVEMRKATPPKSLADIATALNEAGYRTSADKPFSAPTVWRIAKRVDPALVESIQATRGRKKKKAVKS